MSIHGEDQRLFQHSSVLSDITRSLQVPTEKWPSLVVMIADASTHTLLSQAMPKTRKLMDNGSRNSLCLQLDPETAFSDRPVLIAYSGLSKRKASRLDPTPATCHTESISELAWLEESSEDAMTVLCREVLYSFADIVCLFAAKADSIEHLACKVKAYCKDSHTPYSHFSPSPRMLVVLPPRDSRDPQAVYMQLLKILSKPSFDLSADFLSRISVYSLDYENMSLRDRIRLETDISRSRRAENLTLWTAAHFEHLFHRACDHFIRLGHTPFDMLIASRLHRPVSTTLRLHLTDLLTHVKHHQDTLSFAAPYIAECLLRDNYTFDVHGTCISLA
jgi:hypothetical protein